MDVIKKSLASSGTSNSRVTSLLVAIEGYLKGEHFWYIGIKGDDGVKSKGTRLLIEKEKGVADCFPL